MASNREWTTSELKYLRDHYPAGMPVSDISSHLQRSSDAIRKMAQKLGLAHPCHSSRQAIANFVSLHGKPLREVAREYRDIRLSRTDLAHDIGVERKALREALGDEFWHSWPHMTIGRIDAVRQRSTAA